MRTPLHKGITLIEFLLVFAVLGLIFSVVTSQFSSVRERQVLRSAVSDILSSLNKARSMTLSSLNSSSYGVHFSSDEIIIFSGTAFSSGDPDNESVSLTLPAVISDVTLDGMSGSSGNFYFERLSGDPSKSGTVTVSTPIFSETITISATGSFSAN
jgi:type II secretory pathway pseudopilin PulG